MDDDNLIDRIAIAVAKKINPPIPIGIDLWSADEIAVYLKVSRRQVLERYAPLPDFPKTIKLPAVNGGKGHPRWKAREIIAWAEGHTV